MAITLVLGQKRQVPAGRSAAFGAIAERFRRAGERERAVTLCREGLNQFPNHLSARVTLGWALLNLGRYDEARQELERVVRRAPDNLAAIRALAELHDRTEEGDTSPVLTPWDADAPEAEDAPAFAEIAAVEIPGAALEQVVTVPVEVAAIELVPAPRFELEDVLAAADLDDDLPVTFEAALPLPVSMAPASRPVEGLTLDGLDRFLRQVEARRVQLLAQCLAG